MQILSSDTVHELQQDITRWQLVEDGLPFQTPTSVLRYVFAQGKPAVLKAALCTEEHRGAELLRWWSGEGAIRVLGNHENVALLERACGKRPLAAMAQSGQDEEASRIICGVGARLHAHPYVQRDWKNYARTTAQYAFGVPGDIDIASAGLTLKQITRFVQEAERLEAELAAAEKERAAEPESREEAWQVPVFRMR